MCFEGGRAVRINLKDRVLAQPKDAQSFRTKNEATRKSLVKLLGLADRSRKAARCPRFSETWVARALFGDWWGSFQDGRQGRGVVDKTNGTLYGD
jgi:hypothetical protein